MAWSIVGKESKLEKRTRLQNSDDIRKLLAVGEVKTSRRFCCLNIVKAREKHRSAFEGGRATESIDLDLSEVKGLRLEANAFEGMTSLAYLKFFYPNNEYGAYKVHLPDGGLDFLPDSLRWLEWSNFSSKSLPSTFSAENLIYLTLRGSPKLKRCWEGAQPQLANLVSLNLSRCTNLVAIPNLSGSPNLQYLFLKACESLIELPSHVQDLDKLTLLDLDGCTNLRSVPPKLNSKFLKCVGLANCPKVTRCPEIISRELNYLDLRETPVVLLPAAIYNIKQDGVLRLCGEHITSFPAISTSLEEFRLCHTTITEMNFYDDDDHHQQGSLPRFVRLDLAGNLQLKSLSRNIWKMVSQRLILKDCPSIETLPEISHPVTGLIELRITGCRNLKSFPTGINHLKSLQGLCFTGTDITSLPDCILELDQLSFLNLDSNKSLEFVPSNIQKLSKLSYLSLIGCSRIQSLPKLPPSLQTLELCYCESLQALPSNIDRLRWEQLYFEDCLQLDMNLPKEVVHNFPKHATSNLHRQGVLQYSGTEIPGWFVYTSVNYENDSCMMVQLPPPNCTTKQLIKGITFGIVCSSDIGLVHMQVKCDCNIGTTTAASWSSRGFGFGRTQSDNVYIWYDKNLLGEIKQGIREEAEPWYERYLGGPVFLRFTLQPDEGEDPKKLKSVKIKSVGVSLLY